MGCVIWLRQSLRVAGPGGARSVVAESVIVKHQLLILNRSRKRSPNLHPADRVVAGLCALFMRPGRLIRSAIVFKPSTLLSVGAFIGDASNCREPQIDGRWPIVGLFEVDPIAQDDGAIEGQPRLRTVPGDDFPDSVLIRALATGGGHWRNTVAGAAGAARLVPVPATSSRP